MKVYLHDVFEISLNVTSGLCSFAKIIDFIQEENLRGI